MSTAARFQVTETRFGYAVKDTRDGAIWTKPYKYVGWAARKAIQLNESTKNHTYLTREFNRANGGTK